MIQELKPETSAEGTGVRGRGQGRARGRGRGDGRGGGPSGSEMIASGPFALGPTALGHATQRRGAPRSNFAPVIPTGAPSSSSLGSGLTKTTAPSLKSEEANSKILDIDAYSDPDDGVEIIDIDDVRQMDWMAPESLKKEKAKSKKNGSRNMDIQRKGKVKGVCCVFPSVVFSLTLPKLNLKTECRWQSLRKRMSTLQMPLIYQKAKKRRKLKTSSTISHFKKMKWIWWALMIFH